MMDDGIDRGRPVRRGWTGWLFGKRRNGLRPEHQIDRLSLMFFPFTKLFLFRGTHTPGLAHSAPLRAKNLPCCKS